MSKAYVDTQRKRREKPLPYTVLDFASKEDAMKWKAKFEAEADSRSAQNYRNARGRAVEAFAHGNGCLTDPKVRKLLVDGVAVIPTSVWMHRAPLHVRAYRAVLNFCSALWRNAKF